MRFARLSSTIQAVGSARDAGLRPGGVSVLAQSSVARAIGVVAVLVLLWLAVAWAVAVP